MENANDAAPRWAEVADEIGIRAARRRQAGRHTSFRILSSHVVPWPAFLSLYFVNRLAHAERW